MPTKEIIVPYNFVPRTYQLPLLEAMDSGYKRAFCLIHRRAGKDKTLINLIAKKCLEKIGVYYYFFPTYAQGKKIIWDGIDGQGFPFIDHFPKEIVGAKNSQEMKVELTNGSIFQIVGTDKYDSVRGTNPIGCIFSEYAFQNPMAWEVVRPILKENGGWAVFNTTPNGKNHSYDLDMMARDNEKWFTQFLTVDDTRRDDGTPVITKEMIQEERLSGMSEEMIQQEYYCSYEIGALGSIYGSQMADAWSQGRIVKLPFYIDRTIDIYFDIGISKGNETALWFKQTDGDWHNFINYNEGSGKSFDYYASYIEEYLQEINGKLGTIYIPHDAKKRDWTTGENAVKAFKRRFGNHKIIRLEPNSPSDTDGLQNVRRVLPKCRFDIECCKEGIKALENYKYEYDNVKKVFRKIPYHDWASNGSDSMRYFAMTVKDVNVSLKDYAKEVEATIEVDVFADY